MTCIHCGGPNDPERVEVGRFHCTSEPCIQAWLASRRAGMSMVLMHKVGYVPQFTDQVTGTNKHA